MTPYSNNCPICNKVRYFKTKSYLNKSNKKNIPCRSCSNSIQLGGKGNLFNDLGEKFCIDCNIYKPICEFHKNKKNYIKSTCIDCSKKRSTVYHESIYRFAKYDITKEQFDKMINAQSNKCLICKTNIDEKSSHIDHCHTTGTVRGILCEKCNKGLGQFDDNIEFLTNAIKYLKNEWN